VVADLLTLYLPVSVVWVAVALAVLMQQVLLEPLIQAAAVVVVILVAAAQVVLAL
jgi:hypothetical protein